MHLWIAPFICICLKFFETILTFSKLWVQMSQLFARTSELHCMSAKCSYSPKTFHSCFKNLVIVSVIWPRPSKYTWFLSSCEPHWSKCLVVFFSMTVNRGNLDFIKNKSDICWEESIVHRKKFVFIQYIYFSTNVLHVKWNFACTITVHLIFPILPQIQNNIHENNYSWWTSCRSCWSGQRFSSTSHLMFSIAMHRGKKNLLECRTHPLHWSAVMSSHAAFMASNKDIWSCGLWYIYIYTHSLYTPKLDWLL